MCLETRGCWVRKPLRWEWSEGWGPEAAGLEGSGRGLTGASGATLEGWWICGWWGCDTIHWRRGSGVCRTVNKRKKEMFKCNICCLTSCVKEHSSTKRHLSVVYGKCLKEQNVPIFNQDSADDNSINNKSAATIFHEQSPAVTFISRTYDFIQSTYFNHICNSKHQCTILI